VLEMKIEGFDELFKNLKELELDFDNELKKAIRRAGKKIKDTTQLNFRRNFRQRSGKGEASIKLVVKEKNDEIYSSVVAGGGNEYYMPFLELGTSKIVAKPYMRPAIDEHQTSIVEDVKQELQKAIQRAERRVKK
jgi:HK97 gp10 family phage protein